LKRAEHLFWDDVNSLGSSGGFVLDEYSISEIQLLELEFACKNHDLLSTSQKWSAAEAEHY